MRVLAVDDDPRDLRFVQDTLVAAALRRREVAETLEPCVLGDLTIDHADRRVTLAGRPFHLLTMGYRMAEGEVPGQNEV